MQRLMDGTKISDRTWEESVTALLLEDLESAYCRDQSYTYYEYYNEYLSDNTPHYIENYFNFKDVRDAEEYIITDSRVYKPTFEFIRHKNRKDLVPVFLETADFTETDEEALYKKYRDICLSCKEFVVLCGWPVFDKNITVETSPEDLCEKIEDVIQKVLATIKEDKTEHETITAKLIKQDCYLDEDGIPDCTVLSLRAFHFPKKTEEKITDRKIKITITAVLDKELIKDGMFTPEKDEIVNHEKYMKMVHAFTSFKFSLDKRHHYNTDMFLSYWNYVDGVLTLEYRKDSFTGEPLLRYLKKHSPDEVKAIRRPVFDPYYYTPYEDEYSYIPLAESADTKITNLTIEYGGNTYKVYEE